MPPRVQIVHPESFPCHTAGRDAAASGTPVFTSNVVAIPFAARGGPNGRPKKLKAHLPERVFVSDLRGRLGNPHLIGEPHPSCRGLAGGLHMVLQPFLLLRVLCDRALCRPPISIRRPSRFRQLRSSRKQPSMMHK